MRARSTALLALAALAASAQDLPTWREVLVEQQPTARADHAAAYLSSTVYRLGFEAPAAQPKPPARRPLGQ